MSPCLLLSVSCSPYLPFMFIPAIVIPALDIPAVCIPMDIPVMDIPVIDIPVIDIPVCCVTSDNRQVSIDLTSVSPVHQCSSSLTSHLPMPVRFAYKVGQIGPKWDKSGTFSDLISVHFGSSSQNVLKSDLKKSRICPI